jgi:L,D-peptidoglycan transpeptidase YkuD (ErfK/YbiS/YcfS/YnhG family)
MALTRREVAAGAGAILAGTSGPALAASRTLIKVRARPGATTGVLTCKGKTYPCAVGRSGVLHPKFEGDGGTPAGVFPLREIRYRPDRLATAPASGLPVYKATPTDGWCDDPADPFYNRVVHMPYQTDAETMWRDDHLYDVLAVIGYNDAPTVPGAGSAIFLHVAHDLGDHYGPTSGCVALKIDDLLSVLAACTPGSRIDIRQGRARPVRQYKTSGAHSPVDARGGRMG